MNSPSGQSFPVQGASAEWWSDGFGMALLLLYGDVCMVILHDNKCGIICHDMKSFKWLTYQKFW